jgi:two-component system, NarL family, invasion response regulator UvrY
MPNRVSASSIAADASVFLLIVDDHPALRLGLRSVLASQSDFKIAAEADSGEEAYAAYRRHRPDTVILDLSMAGCGGHEALKRIKHFDPQARILIYTVHSSEVMLARALGLGALGYVTKGSDIDVLIQGIREVAQHRGFVSPDMVHAMVRRHASPERSLTEQLSDREFQVLLLTAQGNSVHACAHALNLSDKTVSNHLTQVKAKLQVAHTADLIRLAIGAGLVQP